MHILSLILNIGGIIFNLIGSIILFISIKPSQQNLEGDYTDKGLKIYHNALLDFVLAKRGIRFIILGFALELVVIVFRLCK